MFTFLHKHNALYFLLTRMFSDTSTWQKVNFPRDAKTSFFENIAPIIVHVVFKANSF